MSEPERVGDIAMRVLAELLDREFPVTEGVSEVKECDNGGGPNRAVDATLPGPDHQSFVINERG